MVVHNESHSWESTNEIAGTSIQGVPSNCIQGVSSNGCHQDRVLKYQTHFDFGLDKSDEEPMVHWVRNFLF